jgi:hypothetical protein
MRRQRPRDHDRRGTYEPCGGPKRTLVVQAVRARKASGAFVGFVGMGPPSDLNFPSFPETDFKRQELYG